MRNDGLDFADSTYVNYEVALNRLVEILRDSISPGTSIVSGTKTVTTAGTRVQVTALSTPCKYVMVCADLGNTNPIVVGDNAVVAANSSQKGIVLIAGNDPVKLDISDLSLLWVDSQTNGDKLTYLYAA